MKNVMMKNGKEGGNIVKTNWDKINENFLLKGLKIFPVQQNGKTPLIQKWQDDCSCETMQVLYWYEMAKDCNWGLPATPNGLFIIDLDVHDINKNGVENFKKLMKELGVDSINTMMQTTPSGGVHLIYQTNDLLKNVPNCSNAFKDYPGIDIRTDGYIVVEPSIINGKSYVFSNIMVPMPMPAVLQQYILDNVGTKEEKKKSQYTKPKEVLIGNRDTALFEYINSLYYKTRLDYDEVLTLANKFNDEVLEEGFPKRVVEYKVKKAFQKDRGICIYVWLGDNDEENKDN